jgi:hypothetical protein
VQQCYNKQVLTQELAMSMHLVGPYMTTTQYSRKKKTKNKSAKQIASELAHDKWLRARGIAPDQLKAKLPTNAKGERKGIYSVPDYTQHQGTIGCSNNIVGSTAKRHENTYTGNELAGIGMLHKSNMVPVRKDSNDAKEIARMRRG